LIDVSLVLLIFFIMTAATTAAPFILLPSSKHYKQTVAAPSMYWIGINYHPETNRIDYSLGDGTSVLGHFDSQNLLMDELQKQLTNNPRPGVELQIKAHQDLPEGAVGDILVAVDTYPGVRAKVAKIHTGVR
jgi:biopolymer transport protein ExbD